MSRRARRHLVIPDRQNKPDVPLEHNYWIGRAVAKYRPDVVIAMGDDPDFESISTHSDPGTLSKEGKRLKADIDAYNEGERLYREGLRDFEPDEEIKFRGNHDHRLTRFIERNPVLEGLVGFHLLDDDAWDIVPYQDGTPGIRKIDGIRYAHYFAQPLTGKPIGGTIATRIAKIGGSFVQGHEQGLKRGDFQYATGETAYGLVAGSCYIHDEPYKGAANKHWRGIVVLNEVKDGQFCDMPLSLDYLCREFEGMSLARYLQRRYRRAKERFSLARAA